MRFVLSLCLIACLTACSDGSDSLPSQFSFADAPGPLAVGTRTDVALRDESRDRDITVSYWYPADGDNQGALAAREGAALIAGDEQFPLVLLIHGIFDDAGTWDYLGPHLASHGYIVQALSTGSNASNGADIVNHPGDVSFLIDTALGLTGADALFNGRVEADDMLLGGFSFGGIATYLFAYEAPYRDDRVSAVIIFASLGTGAAPVNPDLSLLVMHGTLDELVPYATGLDLYEAANAPKYLVTLQGGGHGGFTSSVTGNGDATMENTRQKSLTRVTVLAYLTALFADNTADRNAAQLFLREDLAAENVDVDVMSDTDP